MYATAAVCSLALTIGLAACDSESGESLCDTTVEPGLRVTVLDGETAICNASVVAQDGRYWEQLVPVAATATRRCSYEGALGRPGEYRVEVALPGFQDAVIGGLLVVEGPCTVATVEQELALTSRRSTARAP